MNNSLENTRVEKASDGLGEFLTQDVHVVRYRDVIKIGVDVTLADVLFRVSLRVNKQKKLSETISIIQNCCCATSALYNLRAVLKHMIRKCVHFLLLKNESCYQFYWGASSSIIFSLPSLLKLLEIIWSGVKGSEKF